MNLMCCATGANSTTAQLPCSMQDLIHLVGTKKKQLKNHLAYGPIALRKTCTIIAGFKYNKPYQPFGMWPSWTPSPFFVKWSTAHWGQDSKLSCSSSRRQWGQFNLLFQLFTWHHPIVGWGLSPIQYLFYQWLSQPWAFKLAQKFHSKLWALGMPDKATSGPKDPSIWHRLC